MRKLFTKTLLGLALFAPLASAHAQGILAAPGKIAVGDTDYASTNSTPLGAQGNGLQAIANNVVDQNISYFTGTTNAYVCAGPAYCSQGVYAEDYTYTLLFNPSRFSSRVATGLTPASILTVANNFMNVAAGLPGNQVPAAINQAGTGVSLGFSGADANQKYYSGVAMYMVPFMDYEYYLKTGSTAGYLSHVAALKTAWAYPPLNATSGCPQSLVGANDWVPASLFLEIPRFNGDVANACVLRAAAASVMYKMAIAAGDSTNATYFNNIFTLTSASIQSNFIVAAVATPGTVTPAGSTTGGTLAAATYYYKVTALNALGETLPSAEASVTTTGTTSSVALTWAAVTGATGYKVYRGTAAAGENVYYTTTTNSYTDTNAASTAGAVPTANTTSSNGMLVGATGQGRQIDVLTSTMAVWFSGFTGMNILTPAQQNAIGSFLHTNLTAMTYNGFFANSVNPQTGALINWNPYGIIPAGGSGAGPLGSYTAACTGTSDPNPYQNGYWSLDTGMAGYALSLTNPGDIPGLLAKFRDAQTGSSGDPAWEYYTGNGGHTSGSCGTATTPNTESPQSAAWLAANVQGPTAITAGLGNTNKYGVLVGGGSGGGSLGLGGPVDLPGGAGTVLSVTDAQYPQVLLKNTAGPTNQKRARFYLDTAGSMFLQFLNDAESAATSPITIPQTGGSVSSINFAAPVVNIGTASTTSGGRLIAGSAQLTNGATPFSSTPFAGSLDINNGSGDSNGIRLYYGAVANLGFNVSNLGVPASCSSSSILRFVNNFGETGGAVIGGIDTAGNLCGWNSLKANSVAPKTYTVATLPTPASVGAGGIVVVTDATATTGGTCTGGGTAYTVAVSTGSAWTCNAGGSSGSSSSVLYPSSLTVPLASQFGAPGTYLTVTDKTGHMIVTMNDPGSVTAQALAANATLPATPYTIDLAGSILGGYTGTNGQSLGVAVYNSAGAGSSYLTSSYSFGNPSSFARVAWSNALNTPVTTMSSTTSEVGSTMVWLRITDDGTTRTYYSSTNGFAYYKLGSEAHTTGYTNAAILFYNNTGGLAAPLNQAIFTIYHFLVTGSVLPQFN